MDDLIKVKMWHAEYENLRINFHINSIPWRYKHIHDYWEIQIMLSGEARNIINGRELSISKGEMQILRPDDTHVFTSFDNKEYACLNIEIKKDNFVSIVQSFYPSLMNRLLSEESHVPICFLTQNILLNIQNHLSYAQREIDITNENRQFFLTKILLICLEAYVDNRIIRFPEKEYSFSDMLIELMRRPEYIGLHLGELCNKINYSVEYVIRAFAKEGKESPNKVFRKIKLEYACGLLCTTEYKIINISEIIGFNSLWYFNKIFLEAYGITPSQFRNKHISKY